MPWHRAGSVLAIILLGIGTPARAGEVVEHLSDEAGEAPFILSVPAKVVRANHGLAIVLRYDGPERRLVFRLDLQQVVVTLRQDGRETQLARVAAALPGAGQDVAVKRFPGGFAVAFGAVTVLRGKADLPDGGRWGVSGAPAAVLDQVLLQPTGEVFFTDDFMRAPDAPSPWSTLSGDWRVARLSSARYSVNAFNLLGRATGPKPALTTAGHWFWDDLTVEASVRPPRGAGGFGVGLAGQPDGQVYLLRFVTRPGPAGRVQLVRVSAGGERVLAEAQAVAQPDDWHRLALTGADGQLTGALDGVELVAAPAAALAHGKMALWVSGPKAVAFDDVKAYSGPREAQPPVVLSHEAELADPGAEAFVDDRYMKEWADESDQWLAGADGLWQAGYFWGDVALTWEVAEGGLAGPVQLHLGVPAEADTFRPCTSAVAGCHLELAPAADGHLALTLRENREPRAQQTIPRPELPTTVSLRRVADTIQALVGNRVVAGFTTTLPAGGKVGFTGRNARRQADRLSIISRQVIDSTFRSAPTEWTIGSGEWGVSSRWACTPRWSWFQGRAAGPASIWTRRRFDGDLVVEFFAGIPMDQPWAPFYQHPGNLAVTLAGDDGTPGSGYSLIFAGWGNSASGIFRRGELVAKAPGVVMPDILDSLGGGLAGSEAHKLHNEWWRIRAEKIGDTVRLLVDGKVAASFTDPHPLPSGSVGIWTLDQAITVARARIYYQAARSVLPPVPPTASVATRPGLSLPRFGPPHLATTFEQGLGGWRAAATGACKVALAERGPGEGVCLEVVDPAAGGSFALSAPFAGVDLRDHPLLAFDYALPDDVRIDLFATVGGRRYRVGLTGPAEPTPGTEDVGRVDAVQADGRWHAARIDLLGLLAPYGSGPDPLTLEALEFAAYAAGDYLRAGIGGNPAGARWRLDHVYLGGVTAEEVSVPAPRGVTVRAAGGRLAGDGRRLRPERSGLASVRLTSGGASVTDLVAFDLDPPALEPVEPRPGAAWLGPRLTVSIRDVGPAGIDERSLGLRCAGRRFTTSDRALRWDPAAGRLSLDLRSAGLQPAPGAPVEVSVSATDRAGHRAQPLAFTFTPERRADTTPPAPPTLVGLPPAKLACDFETDLGPVRPWGVDAGVALRRSRNGPRTGEWCLEARSTKLGGLFGVSLGAVPYEASRYPVLEFDYRIPRELRVDLVVAVDGRRRVIKFTDNDETWPIVGRVGALADGEWHHATVDLGDLLAKSFGRGSPLVVTDLAFASSGWPGNRQGLSWWLDDLKLSAAVDVHRLPRDLALRSSDESGVAGFAWLLDGSPATEPPAEMRSADLPGALTQLAGKLAWLHVAAVDGAGNRSGSRSLPLRLVTGDDRQPPVADSPAPAAGERACPAAISVKLTDTGSGISPADLRLSVNGRTWTVADEALAWDAAAGQVTWSLPPGWSLGADGSRVACRLAAADLAGNVLRPLEWAFRLDRSRHLEAPAAPVVSYLPARCADRNGFETDTGGWGDFMASQVLRRSAGGATGPGCVALRQTGQDRGNGFALVRDFGESWRDFPEVRFRYRAVDAPHGSLQVLGTTFDGDRERWTPLGSFPVGGAEWRTAVVDVARELQRTSPAVDIHRIFLSVALPPDGVLLVDDYAMYSPVATSAAFRWSEPSSPSGIAGYSWVLDTADGTGPPEKLLGTARQAEFHGLKPGRHVFHVRARSGAGKWGPAGQVPFELAAADGRP